MSVEGIDHDKNVENPLEQFTLLCFVHSFDQLSPFAVICFLRSFDPASFPGSTTRNVYSTHCEKSWGVEEPRNRATFDQLPPFILMCFCTNSHHFTVFMYICMYDVFIICNSITNNSYSRSDDSLFNVI